MNRPDTIQGGYADAHSSGGTWAVVDDISDLPVFCNAPAAVRADFMTGLTGPPEGDAC